MYDANKTNARIRIGIIVSMLEISGDLLSAMGSLLGNFGFKKKAEFGYPAKSKVDGWTRQRNSRQQAPEL